MEHIDYLIIGAGTAGLTAAKQIAKHTDNYILADHGPFGTTCARVGCMPSKVLIEAANACAQKNKFETFGITGAQAVQADIPAVLARVRKLRDRWVQGVVDSTQKFNVVKGAARFKSKDTVEVENTVYKARHILVCTGSRPRIPDIYAQYETDILTNRNLFEQTDLPASLAVIGLGNIGLETGQALARLGVKITAFEPMDKLGGLVDDDIHKAACAHFGTEMDIHLGAKIERVEKHGGQFTLHHNGQTTKVGGLFVSAGRVPDIVPLGMEEAGFAFDGKMPVFDSATLKVKDAPVYLAGDINGLHPVLHEAATDGKIAANHAMGKESSARRQVPFVLGFTDPAIAKVGTSEGDNLACGYASFANQGRATAQNRNTGCVKIYANRSTGLLKGAVLFAPGGEHFAHLFALAIENGLRVSDMLSMPFYHPTLEEGLRTALRALAKQIENPNI